MCCIQLPIINGGSSLNAVSIILVSIAILGSKNFHQMYGHQQSLLRLVCNHKVWWIILSTVSVHVCPTCSCFHKYFPTTSVCVGYFCVLSQESKPSNSYSYVTCLSILCFLQGHIIVRLIPICILPIICDVL